MHTFKIVTPVTEALLQVRADYGVTNMRDLAERLNAHSPYHPVSGMVLSRWSMGLEAPAPTRVLQWLVFAPPGDPARVLARRLLEIGGHIIPPE